MSRTEATRRLAWALSAALLDIPGAAGAAQWLLFDLQGQAPQRVAYLAEARPAQTRLDDGVDPSRPPPPGQPLPLVHRLLVVAVHEAADRPDTLHFQVELRCPAGQARFAQVVGWGRDGRATPMPATAWGPVGRGWVSGAQLVACEPERWQAAWESDRRRGGASRALAALGLLPLGDRVIGTDLVDAVWQQVWPDGQRPAYANDASPAELAARKRAGQAQLARGAAALEQEAADLQALMAATERFNARLQRMPDTVVRAFQGMTGLTEAQVVKAWGPPAQVTRAEGQVRLVFQEAGLRSGVTDTPVSVVNGNGQVVGQTVQSSVTTQRVRCQRALLLQAIGSKPEPRVVDFQSLCS